MSSLLLEVFQRPYQRLPRLGADQLVAKGRAKATPEDFVVEELPDTDLSGEGEHLFLWVEKRDVPATTLFAHVAERLGIERSQIGYAGLKDTRAVTRQWLSVPARAEPRLADIATPSISVLRTERHHEKLRTGHLRGNHFTIRLTEVDAPERVVALAQQLRERGLPNYFGAQRFGHTGATLALGLALLRGERRMRPGTLKRLALSAVQSALFNAYLAARLVDRLQATVLHGDILLDQKLGTQALAMDVAAEQARLATGRVAITGPMLGAKMRGARSIAGEREAAALAASGLSLAQFNEHRALVPGTRRPLLAQVPDLQAHAEANTVVLRFSLPAGSYATVLLSELLEPSSDWESLVEAEPADSEASGPATEAPTPGD